MFNTQTLLSWMGFIWSLLKSRGFFLISDNVRLKSQEEVSEAVKSVFFFQQSSFLVTVLDECMGGKGVVLSEKFRDPDSLCVWLSTWISMASSN